MGGLFHLVLRRLDRCGVRAVVIVRAFILIGQDFLVDLEILDQRVDLLDADRAGHDQAKVSPLRCSTGCHLPRLVADRGYDAKTIVEMVHQHRGEPHIPTQRDRKVQRSVDPGLYGNAI